jgi:hypothetical protein
MDYKQTLYWVVAVVLAHFIFAVVWLWFKIWKKPKK